jgi:hypothetical protein
MKANELTKVFVLILLGAAATALAGVSTMHDSTQPRGAPQGGTANDQGQSLAPIVSGFRAPALHGSQQRQSYFDWAGMTMANATRDPAYFSAVYAANKDLIRYVNSLAGEPQDPSTPMGAFLRQSGLENDIHRAPDGSLQPEDLLPVTAGFCLRCHSPVGWLEAHCEPAVTGSPFLKGQFWGAALVEKVHPVSVTTASEAEMEGEQCGFCHRVKDNYKRKSLYDGSPMPAGNGGFFVARDDPFGTGPAFPVYPFQRKPEFCGTCHDITTPLFKTVTKVNGAVPDMLHPFERTYTEWYWSAYRAEGKRCQDCHKPMKFLGAQTLLLYPGLDRLWGDLDRQWTEVGYQVPPRRIAIYRAAAERNRRFMRSAAGIGFVEAPRSARKGKPLTLKVKVTNESGHKLPTGFPEGRQMWLHIRAVDGSGRVVFEDGVLDAAGALVRTPETKVYEIVPLAEGYPPSVLDADGDGVVSREEKLFHAILFNCVEKDNRIPPRGFKREAYMADGAFIVPRDPKDNDYADGQNWDITPYTFTVPATAKGRLTVTAILEYQSLSKEFIEFQRVNDTEKTQAFGGRARNLPKGEYGGFQTWGSALYQLWKDTGMGPPVVMGEARLSLGLR